MYEQSVTAEILRVQEVPAVQSSEVLRALTVRTVSNPGIIPVISVPPVFPPRKEFSPTLTRGIIYVNFVHKTVDAIIDSVHRILSTI